MSFLRASLQRERPGSSTPFSYIQETELTTNLDSLLNIQLNFRFVYCTWWFVCSKLSVGRLVGGQSIDCKKNQEYIQTIRVKIIGW
jgi:hypothetical protein